MQLLIDTHILIWFLEGNKLLSKSHRQIIINPRNDVFVSIASLWEIAIKISIGKLTLVNSLAEVIEQLTIENIEVLTITPQHTLQVSVLPFHHRDPFDRIIIAQSQIEDLPIITDDIEFNNYGVKIFSKKVVIEK